MKLINLKLDSKAAVLVTDEGEFVIFEDDYYQSFAKFGINDFLDEESAELLRSHTRVRALVKKGLLKLSYGDNTAKGLYQKLLHEKIDGVYPTVLEAKKAVVILKDRGYINEKRYCERCVEIQLSKLHGRARIYKELMAKGFSSALVKRILDGVTDETFEENLKLLILKNSGKEKEKLRAYLVRAGYGIGMINSCLDDLDF